MFVESWAKQGGKKQPKTGQVLPDSCQVAVVVDNVKVRHCAVALLLARLVFKLLQGDALRVGVDAQHFRRLSQEGGREQKINSEICI